MNDYEAVKQTEFEYGEKYAPALVAESPARTVCQVAALSKPDMPVVFDIVAISG
jgi:enamine deaminase RidA (YjgF/YER057c/UK114 family)